MGRKTDEYPENRTLAARIKAVSNGVIIASNAMRHIKDGLEHIPEPMRSFVIKEVKEANEALDLARKALAGSEDEE